MKPLRPAGARSGYGGPLVEPVRPADDDRVSELIGFAVAIAGPLVGFDGVLTTGLPLLTALVSVIGGLACPELGLHWHWHWR
ncbi:hypothetical protein GCM10023084_14770 [Streptomyces lacrimifluminis]|uniref:Uncharacterized protein n=1 Tax=Streptomyces lacrimifluminis TaxID=1500077 RepID=A0A917KM97_9ACTN|nr:hypothetical protein GCM10012282_11940 [Streptomyces lacrimifluminis]